MSASEKLKALIDEAVWEGGQGGGYRATQMIQDAIPQIVAVVETAEAVRRSEGLEDREADFIGSPFPIFRLAVALAALDEALG